MSHDPVAMSIIPEKEAAISFAVMLYLVSCVYLISKTAAKEVCRHCGDQLSALFIAHPVLRHMNVYIP